MNTTCKSLFLLLFLTALSAFFILASFKLRQSPYTSLEIASTTATGSGLSVLTAANNGGPIFNTRNGSWVKVEDSEDFFIKHYNKQYMGDTASSSPTNTFSHCSNPMFRHCCLGQCRQERLSVAPDRVKYQYTSNNGAKSVTSHRYQNLDPPLPYIVDVLNCHWSRRHRESPSKDADPCNILFVGDSLSSDHAMAVGCELSAFGYRLVSCNPFFGGIKKYGNDSSVNCTKNLYPSHPHFMFEKTESTTYKSMCKSINVMVSFLKPSTVNSVLSTLDSGIALFNWGVHCNEHETCLQEYLEQHYLPIFQEKKRGTTMQLKTFYNSR